MRKYKDKAGTIYQIMPRGTYPFKTFEFWTRDREQMRRLPLEPVANDREKAEKKLAKYAIKHNLRAVNRYEV